MPPSDVKTPILWLVTLFIGLLSSFGQATACALSLTWTKQR